MKKILTVVIIFIIYIHLFSSCDLASSPESINNPPGDILITVVFDMINPGYWHRIDEVNIYQNGYANIQRLEGEEIPASSRLLSNEEFQFLQNAFRDFDFLEDSYLDESYRQSHQYIITYFGSEIAKTVECDNSVYNYLFRDDPEYQIIRAVVNAVNDIRISLIGEDKFAGILEFKFRPEKTVVGLDDEIVLVYEVKSKTSEHIYLGFANQQQLGYKVYHNGVMLAEVPMFFLPATSSWIIPARTTRSQKISWQQTVLYDEYEFSDRKVKSGNYTIVQYLLDGNSPYISTEIKITEKGETPLQARAIKSFARPQELLFELNNRISKTYVFNFNTDRPVGYKITSLETGQVVRADSSSSPGDTQITVEPYGDYVYSEPWDGRDPEGDFLQQGKYKLEMWLIGQDPDYRATREFWVF